MMQPCDWWVRLPCLSVTRLGNSRNYVHVDYPGQQTVSFQMDSVMSLRLKLCYIAIPKDKTTRISFQTRLPSFLVCKEIIVTKYGVYLNLHTKSYGSQHSTATITAGDAAKLLYGFIALPDPPTKLPSAACGSSPRARTNLRAVGDSTRFDFPSKPKRKPVTRQPHQE